MPVTLAKIVSGTASASFQFGEDIINFIYYPGRVTEKTMTSLNAFLGLGTDASVSEATAGFETYNEMLANLLKSWDVYEDDAETIMFPIDANRFSELPISFRAGVLKTIMIDTRPEAPAPKSQAN